MTIQALHKRAEQARYTAVALCAVALDCTGSSTQALSTVCSAKHVEVTNYAFALLGCAINAKLSNTHITNRIALGVSTQQLKCLLHARALQQPGKQRYATRERHPHTCCST
eukprot:7226-Heterococcus_DN1.PRE.3